MKGVSDATRRTVRRKLARLSPVRRRWFGMVCRNGGVKDDADATATVRQAARLPIGWITGGLADWN